VLGEAGQREGGMALEGLVTLGDEVTLLYYVTCPARTSGPLSVYLFYPMRCGRRAYVASRARVSISGGKTPEKYAKRIRGWELEAQPSRPCWDN